jgi:hypothetical protein
MVLRRGIDSEWHDSGIELAISVTERTRSSESMGWRYYDLAVYHFTFFRIGRLQMGLVVSVPCRLEVRSDIRELQAMVLDRNGIFIRDNVTLLFNISELRK